MGIFDQINFNTARTPDSSFDLRLLDTPCDHRIRDESVDFDIAPLLTDTPFSDNSVIYNSSQYSGQIDPEASTTITTDFPYVNDGNTSFSQSTSTTRSNPIVQDIVIPASNDIFRSLLYPPKTNSVSAKEKIILDNGEFILKDFTRYNLFQLPGTVEFTNSNDAGKTIIFTYLADKKKIIPMNKDKTPNYRFEGLNSKSQGIFTIFGRSILSTVPQLFIRYKTKIVRCPKCSGRGVLNDVFFDGQGRLQIVHDFSKLIQDFFKRMLTEKGTNSFDLAEGTDLATLAGIAKSDGLTLDNMVKAEIVNLLFKIRDKQKLQADIQGIGLAEQIAQINRIDVQSANATDINIAIEVLSKSGQIEQISSTIRR